MVNSAGVGGAKAGATGASAAGGSAKNIDTTPQANPNFSGMWELDRERSESTNDYLEAMGLPQIARQAADKLDLLVAIDQTPNQEFKITRRTRIFTETKVLRFGVETLVKNNLIKATMEPSALRTITALSGNRGHLTDTRTLEGGGKVMHVKLELRMSAQVLQANAAANRDNAKGNSAQNLAAANSGTPPTLNALAGLKPCVTTHRYFNKISNATALTDDDQPRAPPPEVKRKR